jgi:hypothetical protein
MLILVNFLNQPQLKMSIFKLISAQISDLFRQLFPRLFEPVDRAVDKGCADLQHAVVVVHAAANVGDGRPLFDARHAVRHLAPSHDLRHHQSAHLQLTVFDNLAGNTFQ